MGTRGSCLLWSPVLGRSFPECTVLLSVGEGRDVFYIYKSLDFQSQLFSIYKLCCYYRLNIFCKRKVHFLPVQNCLIAVTLECIYNFMFFKLFSLKLKKN